MTELAQLDNYQGSDPTMVVVPMQDQSAAHGGQTPFYTTGEGAIWRLRFITVAGFRFAGAGGTRLGLFIQPTPSPTEPWGNGGADNSFTATVPQDIIGGDNFNYTWSTETASAYFSVDAAQGWVAQAGLPLVFLPGNTIFGWSVTSTGGSTSDLRILDGFMQIEKFPQAVTQAGGNEPLGNVYLLPQTI